MSIAGKRALVGQFAVEDDFRVAGALELLEDHFVHAAAGIDQRGGDDGQRAAFLDVARGAEEALRALQRVGIDAAGQHLAGRRHHGVVGARQAGDAVQQDHHVALVLDEALGLLQHHFGDLHVTCRRFVEGGGDDLAFHAARHVGDFLRPLVDQQHDQEDFRVVGGDRGGDVLQHHRLAGARRRHDQGALAHADRRDQVDHPRRVVLGRTLGDGLEILHLHLQPAVGIQRRQVVEVDAMAHRVGRLEIDRVDLQQGEVTLAVLRRADLALDRCRRCAAR